MDPLGQTLQVRRFGPGEGAGEGSVRRQGSERFLVTAGSVWLWSWRVRVTSRPWRRRERG